jgi:type IV pilus assembly protein PilF
MRTPLIAVLAVLVAALACAHGPSAKERRAADIHHDLGLEALRAGRSQEALQEFDLALAADDRLPEAHLGRGVTLEYGFGRLDEAEKAYRRAIALRPGYSEARNDLGQLLARTGRYEPAIAEFDAALGDMMYREPYVARCNKGQVLWRMGRKDDGQRELRACLALAPRYCDGRRELGRLLLGEGRLKEALEELSAYARTCPQRADAHLQLGLARMKGRDAAGAREAFARCEELGPGTEEGEECRRSRAQLE